MASFFWEMSCTTTNFAFFKASSANLALGRLTNGLVQTIHTALSLPSNKASTILVAVSPVCGDMGLLFQKCETCFLCSALARSKWAASKLAIPPTSLPPIALGCPVRENGPDPGLPIFPVIRFKLIKARFFLTPTTL